MHVIHAILQDHGNLGTHLVRLMLGTWEWIPAQRFRSASSARLLT